MANEVTWRQEFPEAYAVPALIERLVLADVLYDLSWHNDTCPSFCLNDAPEPDEHTPRLWIEHPSPDLREPSPYGLRYVVTSGESSVVFAHETDLPGALLALGVSAAVHDRALQGETQ